MKNIFNPFSGNLTPVPDKADEIKYDDSTTGLGANLQVAVDALDLKVESLPEPIVYRGTWNASTNTPTLSNADSDASGDLYQVNVAGSVDFGAGPIAFEVGDKVVNNGTIWEKWDHTDAVNSVNGQTGVVVLDTDDVNEGVTNLYYTESRVNANFATKTTTDLTEGSNLYFTDERALDAVGAALTDTPTVDLVHDDVNNTITATVIDGSITDVKLASGIDASKIADGSVSNTEYQYLNGVTSSIQDQIDAINANQLPETDFVAPISGVAADVVGASFSNASVRAFDMVMIVEDGTDYAKYSIRGLQKSTDWEISQEVMGDDVGIVFSITSDGQIQYISNSIYNLTFKAEQVSI